MLWTDKNSSAHEKVQECIWERECCVTNESVQFLCRSFINFALLSRFEFAVERSVDAQMPSHMQAVPFAFISKPCLQLLHKETPVAGQSLPVLPTPLRHAQWFSDHVERTFESCISGGRRDVCGDARTKTIGACTVQCEAFFTATAQVGTNFGALGTGLGKTEGTFAPIH